MSGQYSKWNTKRKIERMSERVTSVLSVKTRANECVYANEYADTNECVCENASE